MPWDVLIRGGSVVTADGLQQADVAVEGGAVVQVAADLAGGARAEIDARGLHVLPGLIDSHVHFNEPGRTEWEGFDTGSAALAAGGGTMFFDMPLNSHPPTLDGASFDAKRAAAQAGSRCDFALWGGLTPRNLDRMDELAERGVVGFKAFMSNSGLAEFEAADDDTLLKGMKTAAKLGLPVAVHAENDVITSRRAAIAIAHGQTTWRDYLGSRPVVAEVEAIGRAITFARACGCKLHIVHVSSALGAAAMDRSGADVSFETCPHYLLLNEDDLPMIGAPAKCAPPLRPALDQEALRNLLRAGKIDFVASDHSPAPPSMKTGDNAFTVWGGIAGVQSTLAALLTLEPHLPLPQVARLTATHVANRYRLPRKGALAPGFDADLTLVDLSQTHTLTREMLLDRHKLSPYLGRTFRGVVKRTLVRGRTICLDGKVTGLGGQGCGKFVRPGD